MENTRYFLIFLLISLAGSEWLVSAKEDIIPDEHKYFSHCKKTSDEFEAVVEVDMIYMCPCLPRFIKLRCLGAFRSFPYDNSILEPYNQGCRDAGRPLFWFINLHKNATCECSSRHFAFECSGGIIAIPIP